MSGCAKCDLHKSTGARTKTVDLISPGDATNFLKVVNSVLNSERSSEENISKICLHTESPHLLGEFDKKVDDKLVKLIPDDRLFHEIFNRYSLDSNHVVFEITTGHAVPSTLDFATKVSLNRGLSDVTPVQIRRLFKRKVNGDQIHQPQFTKASFPVQFVSGSPVKMKTPDDYLDVPFQESVCLQAKPSKAKHRMQSDNPNRIKELVDWWCRERQLLEFISAFSKLPEGGSIFLGVGEELHKGKQTGKFVPGGTILNEDEQRQTKKAFRTNFKDNLRWLKQSFMSGDETWNGDQDLSDEELEQLVTFEFHKVKNGPPNECVIRIKVMPFAGLCFYKKSGPSSWKVENDEEKELSFKEWVDRMSGVGSSRKRKAEQQQ